MGVQNSIIQKMYKKILEHMKKVIENNEDNEVTFSIDGEVKKGMGDVISEIIILKKDRRTIKWIGKTKKKN